MPAPLELAAMFPQAMSVRRKNLPESAVVVPALRTEREERGTHNVVSASEIRRPGQPPWVIPGAAGLTFSRPGRKFGAMATDEE